MQKAARHIIKKLVHRLLAMCNYNTYDNSKSTATPLSQSAFVQM